MKGNVSKALLYLVMFVLIQLVMTYLVTGVWDAVEGKPLRDSLRDMAHGVMSHSPARLIVIQAAFSIVAMIIFLWRKWCIVSPSYLRSRPYKVLFWAAMAALGTIIPSEVFIELVPLPDLNEQTLAGLMDTRWGYLVICIFAPLVEELVFRGAILRTLLNEKENHWWPIIVSATLFALVHLNPAQMPHAFCLGLLLGWMYYRTHSVIPGIMTHWVNNTVAYVSYNIIPNAEDVRIVDLFGGDMMRVAFAVLFSLMIFLPSLLQLHQCMKRAS